MLEKRDVGSNRKRGAKIALKLCVVTMLTSFVFGISFYFRAFPDHPRPEIGRTYPINNHGFLLYLTKQERVEQVISFALFAVASLIGVLMDRLLDPFDRRSSLAMPNNKTPWNHRWGQR
jgi:hypothetical protein